MQTKGCPTLYLRFLADQLKDEKNGDTITVHLGITRDSGDKK